MLWALGGYYALSLLIGWWGRYRTKGTVEGYFAAERRLPWGLAALSMVATTFAVDTPLAITEYVREGGLAANWRWWNMLIGGMLSVVVFAPLWRRSGVLTDSEILSLRYGSHSAEILRMIRALWLGGFINLIILGWVQSAMRTVLEAFVGLTPSQSYLVLALSTLVTLIYTVWGGLWSVVWTDVVQFALALSSTTLLMVRVLAHVDMTLVSPAAWSLVPGGTEWNWLVLFTFIGVQWWASWYPGAEPAGGGYILQRMASTPSPTTAQRALALFQVLHYAVRPITWYAVALASLIVLPQVDDPKAAYLLMAKRFLSPTEQLLLLVGLIGAYMSTLSTHFNWGASYIARDLRLPEPKALNAGLWSTILLAILSVAIVPFMTSVAGAWNFLLESGAGTGLVLILRWFWRRLTVIGEITALLAPMLGYGLFRWVLAWSFPVSYLATVAFTGIAVLLITLVGRGTPPEQWERFRAQVRPTFTGRQLILWLIGTAAGYAITFGLIGWVKEGRAPWFLFGGLGGLAALFYLLPKVSGETEK